MVSSFGTSFYRLVGGNSVPLNRDIALERFT